MQFTYYTTLVNQRLSVPELVFHKKHNHIVLFSAIACSISLLCLTFCGKKTFQFSNHVLGLCENFFYLCFLGTLMLLCSFSFKILTQLEVSGVKKDSFIICFKKSTMVFMMISLCTYFITLILVSYYTPYIPIEKLLTSVLIICKEANSIMFMLFFSLFAFTFKYDFYFLKLNLNLRPDVEYFMDISDINIKFV